MTDRVRMTSQSVFANPRVTVFNAANPEGAKGEPATVGDQIETDRAHAQDLDRLGLAVPLDRADLEGETRLEPGYQVSVTQLRAQDEADARAGSTVTGGLELAGDTGANVTNDDATPENGEPSEAPVDDVAVQTATSRKAQQRKAD